MSLFHALSPTSGKEKYYARVSNLPINFTRRRQEQSIRQIVINLLKAGASSEQIQQI
ncbi:hypothetical protein [Dulcicalothrix desertica]|uniref:hypothetical protein n=1 Tax=Dulcicalothrix desertica TaxID=32056 RepID=UPI00119B3170|nr:hypothetical protein [Dulcicalothrix desertica]TWH43027.1 hypothetical protein CAL7102_06719 [Dulcicalothrix desertica PCC 7102]